MINLCNKKFSKRVIITLLSAILLSASSLSLAGSSSGSQILSSVRVYASGDVLLWGVTGDWNNLEGCLNADAIALHPAMTAYSELYALAVSSYLQGKTISARVSGCYAIGTPTYPEVQSLVSE